MKPKITISKAIRATRLRHEMIEVNTLKQHSLRCLLRATKKMGRMHLKTGYRVREREAVKITSPIINTDKNNKIKGNLALEKVK